MVSWPDAGTRVTIRYRRPAGSVPPLTDAVGQLLSTEPSVRVRTKSGAIAEFAPADVVALRVLTDAPVRTAQIRALEHAAAAAWPGVEQTWLDGWLLRAGHGVTLSANSAVPLSISAQPSAIPAIVDWYARRGLIPRLAFPERLMRAPGGLPTERIVRVLVRDVSAGDEVAPPARGSQAGVTLGAVTLSAQPGEAWLDRGLSVDVLTAVVDGEVVFGTHAGGAVARAAVTGAPDGTRWVGLSGLRLGGDQSAVDRLGKAMLAWGAERGATRAYIRARDSALAESLGFRLHHRVIHVRVDTGGTDD
ncbi:MAG: GNAT family N-acetyltransferase [Mycobacterium sp.]|uniref:N-acetylglutamate synthase, CG3035 family n=1 Tax=Mycobacterium sp. TaxID=1785 RepID=UPI001EC9DBC8|nr:GNAT family N-acetyltransferase [Mycobacterium sp.]MBW0017488.1 GNAT family N-acetyltransferase [Mycobacterium sp.]